MKYLLLCVLALSSVRAETLVYVIRGESTPVDRAYRVSVGPGPRTSRTAIMLSAGQSMAGPVAIRPGLLNVAGASFDSTHGLEEIYSVDARDFLEGRTYWLAVSHSSVTGTFSSVDNVATYAVTLNEVSATDLLECFLTAFFAVIGWEGVMLLIRLTRKAVSHNPSI